MRKTKACVALQIPDHILVDIFCRIPATSLIQCRLVCKSWHRFFKDPQSTKDLLSRTLPSPSSSLLIYGSTDCSNITSNPGNPNRQCYYFLRDCDMAFTRPNNLAMRPCPKDLEVSFCVRIVGSCNGLLCLNDLGLRFYICNPMTNEFSLLPTPTDPRKFASVSGFGFSPISNVYKVLDIYRIRGSNKVEAMVMTLGSGIWRSIEGNPIVQLHNHSCMTYLNGFLHWALPSFRSFLIYAFDLENEQFRIRTLPPFDYGAECIFGVLRGCLSVVVSNSRYNACVWMMKDYGVEASWTLEHEIHGLLPDVLSSLKYSQVLKLTDKEEVLLLDEEEGELLAYAPGTTRRRSVKVDNVPVVMHGACDYIPNFLPLNNIISGLAPVTEDKAGRRVDRRAARVSCSIVRRKFEF